MFGRVEKLFSDEINRALAADFCKIPPSLTPSEQQLEVIFPVESFSQTEQNIGGGGRASIISAPSPSKVRIFLHTKNFANAVFLPLADFYSELQF